MASSCISDDLTSISDDLTSALIAVKEGEGRGVMLAPVHLTPLKQTYAESCILGADCSTAQCFRFNYSVYNV